MQKMLIIEGIGRVHVAESFWTGRRTISVNGQTATKLGKQTYRLDNLTFTFRGNSVFGLTMNCNGRDYTVVEKTKWYEWLFPLLTFFFVMLWGNVPQLVEIFPIISGAIGGGLCAAIGIVEISVLKQVERPLYKVLLALAFSVATVLLLFVLALVFVLFVVQATA